MFDLKSFLLVCLALVVVFVQHASVAQPQLVESAASGTVSAQVRGGGYLRDPQVVVEVAQVRSRLASIYGKVQRTGRYHIEGTLSSFDFPVKLADTMRPGDVVYVNERWF